MTDVRQADIDRVARRLDTLARELRAKAADVPHLGFPKVADCLQCGAEWVEDAARELGADIPYPEE